MKYKATFKDNILFLLNEYKKEKMSKDFINEPIEYQEQIENIIIELETILELSI